MKRFLAFALAACMILSLAACGKKDEAVMPQEPEPQTGIDLPRVVSEDDESDVGDSAGTPSLQPGGSLDELTSSSEEPEESEEPDQEENQLFGVGSEEPLASVEPDDITLPIEEDEPDEEEGPVIIPNIDTEAGEISIAEDYFGDVSLDTAFLREQLYVDNTQISDEVILNTLNFLKTYSREGFLRALDYSEAIDGNTRYAAVMVCRLINIPYEKLWSHHFVNESIVLSVVELLDEAEKAAKEAQ